MKVRSSSSAAEKHPVDQVLPAPQMFLYGLQHVLSMYAGVVAVPLIIGTALKLSPTEITYLVSAGLFMSGVATLLQTLGVWKIGARQPIVQGTSFAAVSTMLAVGASQGGGTAGLRAIFGALLVAGLLGFLIAPVFTRLLRFFPEVVTGTVITIIGISLLPGGHPLGRRRHARGHADLRRAEEHRAGRDHHGDHRADLPLPARVPQPGGDPARPGAGHGRGHPVRPDQLQPDRRRHDLPADPAVPLRLPTFAVGAIISMFIVMLVIMTETTADILAIGQVIDKPADRQQVTNGLRADMLSTSFASVFNGFSVSAFAQNVGLVAITGIKSRFVVAVGGGILVFLGLFPVLGALVALVPLPVLGGAGLALFGTVAASGIRTLSRVDFSGNANIVIVAFSIGMGIIPIAVPTFYDKFPEWFQVIFDSGITAAAITAVLLNIIFNIVGRSETDEAPDLRRRTAARDDLPGRRGPARSERPRGPRRARAGEPVIGLREFNALDDAAAAALLRPCLDVDRWVTELGRGPPVRQCRGPFRRPPGRQPTRSPPPSWKPPSPTTRGSASGPTAAAPRPRCPGPSRPASPSTTTSSGGSVEGNRAYEQRFGRVFLIRAAGRSSTEILDKLQTRLGNSPDTEDEVVADQLRQIALIRLAGVVSE